MEDPGRNNRMDGVARSALRLAVRLVHGPSLEGPDDCTIVGIGASGAEPPTMDAPWAARCDAVCRALGVPVTGVPAPGPGIAAALADTAERLAALVLGRQPAPVRPSRIEDNAYVVSATPPGVAAEAARLAAGIIERTRMERPLEATTAALRRAVARLNAAGGPDSRPEPGASVKVVAETCAAAGVPWRWSVACPGTLLVGEGRRQVRFDGAAPVTRPMLGSILARNKPTMKRFLASFGLPVPPGRVVDGADAAARAATAIGYPVVVKPVDGSHSHGVTVDVRDATAAREAYAEARAAGSAVMVERYLDVEDFRAVTVGDAVPLVFQRHSPFVVGDGRSTIATLIEAKNAAYRRGINPLGTKNVIAIDGDVRNTLSRCGRTPDTVPADGETVRLRGVPILRRGGHMTDETARTHPSLIALFRRVAAVTALPVAAIDFRAEAVERPWHEQRFGILEVNSRPDLETFGGHRVMESIVRHAVPDADAARLPTIFVVDPDPGDGPMALRRTLARSGRPVAVAADDGLVLADCPVAMAPGGAHGAMVEDPTLAAAVHWRTPRHVAAYGIGAATVDHAFLPAAASDGVTGAVARLVRRHSRVAEALPDGDAAKVDRLLSVVGTLLHR